MAQSRLTLCDHMDNTVHETPMKSWVQFSRKIMSDSLWPHGLQHARLPSHHELPKLAQTCPLNKWCHPTISSSVILFSSCLQSFPVIGAFLNKLFTSVGQSIGVSASASVLLMNIQDFSFNINLLDLLVVQGTLKRLVQHDSSKLSILHYSPFFMLQLSHPYMTTGKTALIILNFFSKVMSLLLKMLLGLS